MKKQEVYFVVYHPTELWYFKSGSYDPERFQKSSGNITKEAYRFDTKEEAKKIIRKGLIELTGDVTSTKDCVIAKLTINIETT